MKEEVRRLRTQLSALDLSVPVQAYDIAVRNLGLSSKHWFARVMVQ